MSLRHLLLGLLEKPRSGYDIKPFFDQVFSHFWHADLAQIYPALNRLEADGLATSTKKPSEKGPARRVYSRNSAGTEELTRWLMEGPTVGQDRNNYLIQVYFLNSLGDQEQLHFFHRLQEHFSQELAELERIDRHWRKEAPGYPDDLPNEQYYSQLTLRLGIKKNAAVKAWCEECIASLKGRLARRKKQDKDLKQG